MTHQSTDNARLRVLHLEDSEPDHALVKREFQRAEEPVDIQRVDTLTGFSFAIEHSTFDVVLADYRLSGFTALDAWQLMQSMNVRTPVVLFSGAIGESAAVAAIKIGISDYLPKEDIGKLLRVLKRAIEMHRILLEKKIADDELTQSEQRLAGFAEHLQATIEQERAAIAREIHDDIGGSLAAVRFDLSWLARHTSEPIAQAHIDSANEMLAHALDASQRIMMSLRPAVLDQGLVAAVHWLASSFSKRTGIPTNILSPKKIEGLSKSIQLTAYRTTQEALTNVGKYAQCTQVKVELSDAEGVLTLEVADNGAGLSPHDLAKATSYGIRGLKERARTVGGWLDVSSQPGCGTAIILSIPLTSVADTASGEITHD
jgi:signal transduction histidine kinase